MTGVLIAVCLLALASCLAAQPEMPAPVDGLVRAALSAGDITAAVGNHADHGAGRTGYIGLHSLTHAAEGVNLFVPRYAGIITARNRASLVRVSGTEAWLAHFHNSSPSQWIHYTLVPPHYIDIEISAGSGGDGIRLNSASYMNGPTDRRIYFVDVDGNWQKHFDPEHGNAASVFPYGMPLPKLETVSDARYKHGTNSFADSVSEWRYDPKLAFYYGRFRQMVYMQMFPPECGVIFYMSPTGGGAQPDGRPNPAWDWRGHFAKGTPAGELATLRMRVVYKPYVSDEDCLEEYRNWSQSLDTD